MVSDFCSDQPDYSVVWVELEAQQDVDMSDISSNTSGFDMEIDRSLTMSGECFDSIGWNICFIQILPFRSC